MGRTTTSISRPAFIVDPNSIDRNGGRQIDWTNVAARFYTTAVVVTTSATASQGATAVTVTALPGAIPSGTTLDFGGAKFARLTADAAAGATSLTVAALPTALASGDTATYVGPNGKRVLPAGTVVGDTLGSGLISPRVASTNTAIGILETTAVEGETIAALSGYGVIVGGVVFENLLPDATGGPPATLAGGIKTELAAAGTGFSFQSYGDNRS